MKFNGYNLNSFQASAIHYAVPSVIEKDLTKLISRQYQGRNVTAVPNELLRQFDESTESMTQ